MFVLRPIADHWRLLHLFIFVFYYCSGVECMTQLLWTWPLCLLCWGNEGHLYGIHSCQCLPSTLKIVYSITCVLSVQVCILCVWCAAYVWLGTIYLHIPSTWSISQPWGWVAYLKHLTCCCVHAWVHMASCCGQSSYFGLDVCRYLSQQLHRKKSYVCTNLFGC